MPKIWYRIRHEKIIKILNQSSQTCNQSIIASLHEIGLINRGFTHALSLMGDEGEYVLGQIQDVVHEINLTKALGHPIVKSITSDGQKIYVPA